MTRPLLARTAMSDNGGPWLRPSHVGPRGRACCLAWSAGAGVLPGPVGAHGDPAGSVTAAGPSAPARHALGWGCVFAHAERVGPLGCAAGRANDGRAGLRPWRRRGVWEPAHAESRYHQLDRVGQRRCPQTQNKLQTPAAAGKVLCRVLVFGSERGGTGGWHGKGGGAGLGKLPRLRTGAGRPQVGAWRGKRAFGVADGRGQSSPPPPWASGPARTWWGRTP